MVYRNENGSFVLNSEATAAVHDADRVTSAIWTDLTGDGFPELVLGCDWGPVRVYRNESGRLVDATQSWGFESHTGWWTGIASGDWDGDGRLDLLLGNWGLNGAEQIWSSLPYHAFYGDWAEDSTIQIIEAIRDEKLNKLVPFRDLTLLRTAIPSLRSRIESHEQYASMSVEEVLGPALGRAKHVMVNTLATQLLLNRGDHFESMPLPVEAQWAPVYGVCVADADGDGFEDAFLSQNCFAVRGDATRLDSGRGLWMRGEGKGRLSAVKASTSGVRIYGEQRGCAVGDFNGDARPDLVVTENGGPVHLFLNRSARPGLRVQLRGSKSNPMGIGAVLQLRSSNGWGPAREVQASSGWGSQSSPVPILAMPDTPLELKVRWPGGKVSLVPVSKGMQNILVAQAETSD